jgi:hypothetical protein|tara:strand:- start:1220 stop:1525 length:306 start_codon:yes stop_codon:yes gene_type:complete
MPGLLKEILDQRSDILTLNMLFPKGKHLVTTIFEFLAANIDYSSSSKELTNNSVTAVLAFTSSAPSNSKISSVPSLAASSIMEIILFASTMDSAFLTTMLH